MLQRIDKGSYSYKRKEGKKPPEVTQEVVARKYLHDKASATFHPHLLLKEKNIHYLAKNS